MAKFKIRDGAHIQGGKTYNKGDVFQGPASLSRRFPLKFESLGESPVAAEPELEEEEEIQEEEAITKPSKKKSKKPVKWD